MMALDYRGFLARTSSLSAYPFTSRRPQHHPTFVALQVASLLNAPLPDVPDPQTPRSRQLISILASLQSIHPSVPALEQALRDFQALKEHAGSSEETELEWAVVRRLVVRTYEECMERLMREAAQDEIAAEWWGRVERVGGGTGWYLFETIPQRICNLAITVIHQPNPMFSLLHPTRHLPPPPHSPSPTHLSPLIAHLFRLPPSPAPTTLIALLDPLRLARLECRYHKTHLFKARDERAEAVGGMLRWFYRLTDLKSGTEAFANEVMRLPAMLPGQLDVSGSIDTTPSSAASYLLTTLDALQRSSQAHGALVSPHAPPSRWTRIWPRLVFAPIIAYFAARSLYASREQVWGWIKDAKETVQGFLTSWVIEPVKDIIKTIRTGEGDVKVVSKEGLKSDLDSLERMAVALATDKLKYTAEQQAELTSSIRAGDLTTVLRIYEDDIKSPLRSAIGGTLVRTLLIQVQKTKVDVDVALSGIDKLLKSQELTFAFVGVAPSITILYFAGSWVSRFWSSGRGRGRYGGQHKREEAWLALRRVEHLLLAPEPLKPLTQGLLVLSLSSLRTYAQTYLPARTRLREGFLEDVGDLEDVSLERGDKRVVVQRMRADWGTVLGWSTVAGKV
ncbi:NCA2-domain-containing protein [Calocera viscosa TUFC12733]|uniref:NCA2-domain-containing protein n=1 Tax=Calocera viscosa (strain TUFC12733) TaxID=1330018 RepID=A0A167MQY7_CALVF|nr:NCA2-domain-containing protein [Calocera viscosa TUFC12733]